MTDCSFQRRFLVDDILFPSGDINDQIAKSDILMFLGRQIFSGEGPHKFLTQFLPRDASAEHGDAAVSRLSVTFRYQQHIGWNSSKIISQPNSLRPLLWLTPNMGDLVQREHPQN